MQDLISSQKDTWEICVCINLRILPWLRDKSRKFRWVNKDINKNKPNHAYLTKKLTTCSYCNQKWIPIL